MVVDGGGAVREMGEMGELREIGRDGKGQREWEREGGQGRTVVNSVGMLVILREVRWMVRGRARERKGNRGKEEGEASETGCTGGRRCGCTEKLGAL